MSNLLIKNGVYNGVIIKTDKLQTKSLAESKLTLLCGARMSNAIHSMAALGLGGMEGLAGIPGTVGGMVKQNAGAFGYETADRFISAECYLANEKRIATFSKEDMRFAYRSSALSDSIVMISATFDLMTFSPERIHSRMNDIKEKRRASQPLEFPSLGSIFKRCNGQSAGYYIDRVGLKGASVGGAEVSKKHAGFIINKGGATADDFLRLIDLVKRRVYAELGIELEEEIEII